MSAMVPCVAVLKSIPMSHGPRENVTQTLLILLSGPGIPPLQQSATSPLRALTHMGNYMPVGRRVKIGADNRASSVLYGIRLGVFRGKTGEGGSGMTDYWHRAGQVCQRGKVMPSKGINHLKKEQFFRLTRDPLRYTMPRSHTNRPRLQHFIASILTEPHC